MFLITSVRSLAVLDVDGEVGSQDYAALSISIDLQRALQAVPDRALPAESRFCQAILGLKSVISRG
jgi:hypothetical protein